MAPLGTPKDHARFWSKVRTGAANACWEWTASRLPSGYGQFMWASLYSRTAPRNAHRVAWEMTYGAIPDGLQVCHSCDNPACCNPKHLFVGSQFANMRDASRKGRLKRKVA